MFRTIGTVKRGSLQPIVIIDICDENLRIWRRSFFEVASTGGGNL
jgi:hypothetical protein